MPLHESAGMYLETIYTLSQRNPFIRRIDVAEALCVDQETAAEDVCKIEHDISDKVLDAIKAHKKTYRMKQESDGPPDS